ncbi:hypothetical protein NIES4101_79240 [Calothrix sp. NIES-4101]|nr:hypothetical protein NIES4101_79240 [Calothrix sp. NIES-4101]
MSGDCLFYLEAQEIKDILGDRIFQKDKRMAHKHLQRWQQREKLLLMRECDRIWEY